MFRLTLFALFALGHMAMAVPALAFKSTFSFAQWVEDIIADPHGEHLTPTEALQAWEIARNSTDKMSRMSSSSPPLVLAILDTDKSPGRRDCQRTSCRPETPLRGSDDGTREYSRPLPYQTRHLKGIFRPQLGPYRGGVRQRTGPERPSGLSYRKRIQVIHVLLASGRPDHGLLRRYYVVSVIVVVSLH